MWREYCSI
jgi:hypothetical protein